MTGLVDRTPMSSTDDTTGGRYKAFGAAWEPGTVNISSDMPKPCASQFDILVIKMALERIEAKMNSLVFDNDDRPQAQPERDDREHRALVMVLRALREAVSYVDDGSADFESMFTGAKEALMIAGFIWPEAFAEATRDEEGGG